MSSPEINPRPEKASGIFDVYLFKGKPVIVNLILDCKFSYAVFYKLVKAALAQGGQLEASNEEIAVFSLPPEGVPAFIDIAGNLAPVGKRTISIHDGAKAKVNIRFQKS